MDRKRQFLQLISIIVLGLSGGVAGQGPAEDSTGTAPKSQDVAPPADTTPVGVTKVTVAAVNFVVAAGQGSHLTGIAAKLAELAADAEGEVVAEVRTPFDLDDAQIERLSAAISKATGKKIQVKIVVDSSVIGGVVAKVGDTVLDGSVQHRFTELREQWG